MLDKNGQLSASVGSVVALLITISIGAMVLYSITGAIERTPNSQVDNTITNVEEKGVTAFNLLSILAIIIVAATIISVVVRAVGGYRRAPPPAPAPAPE